MNAPAQRTLVSLALQLAAVVVLALALLGVSALDTRSKPRVLVLVDRSNSMPSDDTRKALAEVVHAVRQATGREPQTMEFAGRVAAPSAAPGGAASELDPSSTNIETALNAALLAHAQQPLASVVVLSDGHESAGDTARALQALRAAQVPVRWWALGRPAPAVRIADVRAPAQARLGQRIQVAVQMAGAPDKPVRVKLTARAAGGQTQTASAELGPGSGTAGSSTFELDTQASGALLVDVVLEDPASGLPLQRMPDAAVVDVLPPATMLYVQGSSGALAASLARGGWPIKLIPALRLDTQVDALEGLQSVVLDDVAIADASPRFWAALASAVKDRGLGLMVLGGERSFARGGYRGSALEEVLPVLSEPAALDQPAAVLFAVDKSGSMGQGSGGIDRFQMAQRAVLETARGLSERDSVGLVVFDVVPRVLLPLGPAAAGTAALARDWQASPNGGTQLAPALDAAISELQRSTAPRRLLVLVTDGFVDGAPLAELRTRLQAARIETVALAVGPDADVAALQRVLGLAGGIGAAAAGGAQAGVVLRVDQAAELPSVMRSGLERRRARVERGSIAVQQSQALPFEPGRLQGWPPVSAHHVTRPQAGAVLAVQNERGEPLMAYQSVGRGRVVAVTSGLGAWAPEWLAWREWPRLAGGWADWISGAPTGGAGPLVLTDVPAGVQVEADAGAISSLARPATAALAAAVVADAPPLSISVDTPAGKGLALQAQQVAPGRVRALLPSAGPGLYGFMVSTPQGPRRQLHLRQQRAEAEQWGLNPALAAWRTAGLVSAWEPVFAAPARPADRAQPIDRSLLALALLLFLSGVLVDRLGFSRMGLGRAGIAAALQRWRARWSA